MTCKYLTITPYAGYPCRSNHTRKDGDTYYHLPPDGAALVEEWWDSPTFEHNLISGVLADWLEDHLDLLLQNTIGPDPQNRLRRLIQSLRAIFHSSSS